MMALLLFCHDVASNPNATTWLWTWLLLVEVAIGTGFSFAVVRLIRELKGGVR